MTRLFETTTYIEDGEKSLGIRSNKPFKIDGKKSFDDGDGYHVVYLTFSPLATITHTNKLTLPTPSLSISVNSKQLKIEELDNPHSCDNPTCRKEYGGDYNGGYCSDECRE